MDTIAILKEIADSSAQLSTSALAIFGGSVAAILGTSYRRPLQLGWRLPFLLFVPGWICLGYSLYLGNVISGRYLAATMVKQSEWMTIAARVNDDYGSQREWLLASLMFFWCLASRVPFILGSRRPSGGDQAMRTLLYLLWGASGFCFAQPTGDSASSNAAGSASTVACDCTSYPFRPNPPCFGACVGKLASSPNPDLSTVKGLDPGVSVSIRVLAAYPKKQSIDFSSIRGKSDLEQAADKSLRSTDLRFMPPRRQF